MHNINLKGKDEDSSCSKKEGGCWMFAFVFFTVIVLSTVSRLNCSTRDRGKSDQQPVKSYKPIDMPADREVSLRSLMPQSQSSFIRIVDNHIKKFNRSENPLQESAARSSRMKALSDIVKSRSAENWVGVIDGLNVNSEGKAILSIRISPNIQIKTYNNAFSDIGSNTLINKGSDVYNVLFDLKVGQRVRFSGRFFPSSEDYIREVSLTSRGSMLSPEFLFRFQAIEPM